MKYIAIILFIVLAAFVCADPLFNDLLSVALDQSITDGTYLSTYQKWTPVSDPYYTPISKGSCNRRLDAIDLKNPDSWNENSTLARVVSSGKLRLGVSGNTFDNATSGFIGYGTNPERGWYWEMGLLLANELSNILLKPINLQTVLYEEKNPLGPLDSAVDALEAGDVDAIWNFAWTVGRTQRLGLTCWYDEASSWSVVTNGNLTIGDEHPTDLAGWTKAGGEGIKVGTLPGTVTGEVNSLYFPNAELVPYDDQQSLLAGLEKGEADLTLANKGTVDFYKEGNANSTLVAQPNTEVNYGGGAVLITRKN